MKEIMELIIRGKDEASKELGKITEAINDIDTEAKNTSKGGMNILGGAMDSLKGVAVGLFYGGLALVAGGFVALGGTALSVSADLDRAQNQFQASLGSTAEEAEYLGEVVKEVWGNNFGGSIDEVSQAVIVVKQQLKSLADDELQQVVEGAFAIKDAFGSEVTETTNAVKALMDNFGISSEKALNMIAEGFQGGLNSSDDFLDSVREYSNQFKEGGASADEFFNFLSEGLGAGVLGTDKAGDLFKEFVVRIQDGSKLTGESLEMIGIDSKKMLGDLANGTIEPIDAFGLVQNALKKTTNETTLMEAGVGLLGTQFEDLGASAVLAMDTTEGKWGENNKAIEDLNKQYEDFGSMATGIWREIVIATTPMTDKLLEIANDALPHVQAGFEYLTTTVIPMLTEVWNSQLQPVFEQLRVLIMDFLWPAIETFLIPAMINLYNSWLGLYNVISPLILPILGTLASFIGVVLIGAIILLSGFINGLGVMYRFFADILSTTMEASKGVIEGFKIAVQGIIDFVAGVFTGDWERAWNGVKNIFSGVWDSIRSIGKGAMNGIIDSINLVINGLNQVSKSVGGGGVNISNVQKFAKGGDFETNGKMLMMVGDNPGGRERVTVTPKSSTNFHGAKDESRTGGKIIQLSMNGPVFDPVAFFKEFKRQAEMAGYKIA